MSTPEARHDRTDDEAALWAARLRGGGMTDVDRDELARWLRRDPAHQQVLARYRELSAALDCGYAKPPARGTGRRRVVRRVMAPLLAAAAAITALFATKTSGPVQYETGTAERRVVLLGDGSRLELNARTDVRVRLSSASRRVRLLTGEALFSVATDPKRPFEVETSRGVIEVTGTRFAVRATDAAQTEVTVLEGQVRVAGRADVEKTTALDANRQAVIDDARITTRTLDPSAAEDSVAWRNGQVVFDNTPLADALARFAAYDQRTLSVAPEAADLRIGGRFSLEDLEGALAFIERALPVSVVRGRGTVRITTAAAPR